MKKTGTIPDLEILFEDNHLLAVNKPAGILSQEDYTGKPDLLNLCKEYLKREYKKPGNVFLGLLHRLDKPVGGVMLFAKTSKAASRVSEQIRKRSIRKVYYAVVKGSAPKNGFLTHHLLKDPAKNLVKSVDSSVKGAKLSQLTYQCIARNNGFSLLKVALITGRAHQIRVQLASEKMPIIGDRKYGTPDSTPIALFAAELHFIHPTLKNEIILRATPKDRVPWIDFKSSLTL